MLEWRFLHANAEDKFEGGGGLGKFVLNLELLEHDGLHPTMSKLMNQRPVLL